MCLTYFKIEMVSDVSKYVEYSVVQAPYIDLVGGGGFGGVMCLVVAVMGHTACMIMWLLQLMWALC